MDTKASWEVWATRLVSAATVAALGYFVLFVDFTNTGRIWDKLAVRVPALARIIPPAAGSQATVVYKSGTGMEQSQDGDRTLIAKDQAPAAAAQPQAAAQQAAAPAAQAAKQTPTPRLTTSLTGFDVRSAPSQTSASLDASAAAPQSAAAETAASAAPGQSQAASRSVIAAKSSYGAASRSEMMGQAAGPVYNLRGKSRKK